MVDYYSTLLRAVTAPGAGDMRWRRSVYDRARQMLASRLRGLQPPPPLAEIVAEQSALEAAIERIEQELAFAESGALAPDPRTHDRFGDIAAETWSKPETATAASMIRANRATLAAVIVAALGAAGYVYWSHARQPAAPALTRSEAQVQTTASPRPAKALADGDLPPGVDGGATDPDLAYVFRRQPTFYRSIEPAGTVIVDKLQHFLYLIRPNSVALRYGIGLGAQCKDLAGLHHITRMTEWPSWQPPPDLLKRLPAAMPGGPGNPLGARLLELDDGTSRIHGTNAPKTTGTSVNFGCIRLANDDIVDLYNRVEVSTPVVVN